MSQSYGEKLARPQKLLFSSLRFRLFILVSLCIAPPLAVTLYTAEEWRRHEVADGQARALHLTRHASAIHERLIGGARELLVEVAKLPAVRRRDPATCNALLLALWQRSRHYANLGAITPDGKLFCSTLPIPEPINLANRPFFRRAIETRDFAIGDYQISRKTGTTALSVAHPVLDRAGRIQGVVFAVLDQSWLNEFATEAQVPPGTTVTLFDQNGTILARHPDPHTWVGQSGLEAPALQTVLTTQREGTVDGISLDGIPRLFGFRPLPGAAPSGTLFVTVGIPTSVVVAEANEILIRNLSALAVAAVLAMAAAWVASDLFVLRRVKALVSATMRLRGGDLTARTGLASGSGELGQLTRAFDEMAAALERRRAEAAQAEEALRQANEALRGLIHASPLAIITVDPDGTVTTWNPAAQRIFGWSEEEALGRPNPIVPEDKQEEFHAVLHRVMRGESFADLELRRQKKDGSRIDVSVSTAPLRNATGEVVGIMGILTDITERKRAAETIRNAHDELEMRVHERTAELERANEDLQAGILQRKVIEDLLRESQMQLGGIFESAMDGIVTLDEDQRVILFNRAAERIFRCSAAEVMGQPIDRFIPARFRAVHREHVARFGETKQGSRQLLSGGRVFFGLRADGEEFPLDLSISQIEITGRKLYTAILRDVTQRMQAEQELRSSHEQLRALGAHTESVREEERGRIAREVHDELGQALTALKYDLSWLANRLAVDNPGLLAETRAMIKLVDSTIERVRQISSELRPGVLDDLGLAAALEWQAQDFEIRTGITCGFSSGVGDMRLNRETATALFRICQEALTNVIRHAEASRVEIFLEEESAHLILSVRDNGKGIPAEEIALGKSMGILGMRERAQLLGGQVSLVGRPAEGTRITVAIPLERARELMA